MKTTEKSQTRRESNSKTLNDLHILRICSTHISICIIILLTLFHLIAHVDAQTTPDIRLPPYIIVNPQPSIEFRAGAEKIRLNCSAGGQPTPTYQWFKNGKPISSLPGGQISGDIIFNVTTVSTEGAYQCLATNIWGTTMSSVAQLKVATASLYPPNEEIGNYARANGDSLILPCNSPQSFPHPTYSWAKANGKQDQSPSPMAMSSRLKIDPSTGDLYFANLEPTDQLDPGQCYKCIVFNPVLDASTGGSYATIVVNTTVEPKPVLPKPAFESKSPQIGLLGGSITLNCFFYGYPTPDPPTWSKIGGTLPVGYTLSQWNTALTLKNLQTSDAGNYKCETRNSAGSSSVSIALIIQSQPSFTSSPANLNASNGDTVRFTCTPAGDPQPDIVWYRNADPLSTTQLPNKYSLSSNLSVLTIRDVCKTCSDGSSDLAVIQCSSGNNNGQVLGSGYLNVLSRTVIISGPDSVPAPSGTEPFNLPCEALTDPSTPLSTTWYVSGERVYNDSGKWFVDGNGTLHVVGSASQGNYTCMASNGFSTAYNWAWVGPMTLQASGSTWWIFVLIALIILLICLIASVWYYCRNNRGDSYHVDEKEILNGNDPEKELQDTGFQEHRRGDGTGLGSSNQFLSGGSMKMSSSNQSLTNVKRSYDESQGTSGKGAPSGGSISSTLPPAGSEDGGSLLDMSRDRVGKFNDEGSFLPVSVAPIPE